MLRETFSIKSPLHIMEPARVAAVVSGIDASLTIEFNTKCVASPFCENFINFLLRMISPDILSKRLERFFIDTGANHISINRTSLSRVQPAIRSERNTVNDRMRILHSKTSQMNFGVAIGNVVLIFIWIEQQIRSIEHPDAAPAHCTSGGDIQTINKNLVLIENTIAVGIFVNGNLIFPAHMIRRREWHFIVDGSPKNIVAFHLQTGWTRILAIFQQPHAPAGIETNLQRLGDEGFSQELFQPKIFCNSKCLFRCFRFGRFIFRMIVPVCRSNDRAFLRNRLNVQSEREQPEQ